MRNRANKLQIIREHLKLREKRGNMYRILFEFQGRSISAYWFFYALGMLLAGSLGFYLAYRRSQNLLKVCILCLAMIIFAFTFGRINAFCLNGTFSGFFDLREGGQVSFGGVIGALFILIILARILRLPREDALDISACAIPVAQGIQRIGCFCQCNLHCHDHLFHI